MNFSISNDYYNRAVKLIPEQTMTLAKGAHNYPLDLSPKYVKSAQGCEMTDVDGNKFIDYTMGLGPFTLGYNYPRIQDAIINQLKDGTIYSLPHFLEVELAEKIVDIIPSGEMARFFKNGADVTGLAIRLARSYTGKNYIIQCGYHGHHDWYSFLLRDSGILKETKQYTHSVQYNDIQTVYELIDQYKGDVAGIIIETAFEAPNEGYLDGIRELCDREAVVFIFDEMWTGFRFSLGGFQEFIGVTPDLALFSKGIANGYPISVITGKRDIMECFSNLWGFTTFGGEVLSIRAAIETIDEIENENVIDYIWIVGRKLKEGISELIVKYGLSNLITIKGYDCRFMFEFSDTNRNYKELIQKELIQNHVLWNNQFVTSYSHKSEHIDKTIRAFEIALKRL